VSFRKGGMGGGLGGHCGEGARSFFLFIVRISAQANKKDALTRERCSAFFWIIAKKKSSVSHAEGGQCHSSE